MTNGDKIRSMTDAELAEWLDKQYNQDREDWESIGCYNCINYGTHHYPKDCGKCEYLGGLLQWLKREVKTKICDICNTKITETEFKNNDGYCHECFIKFIKK